MSLFRGGWRAATSGLRSCPRIQSGLRGRRHLPGFALLALLGATTGCDTSHDPPRQDASLMKAYSLEVPPTIQLGAGA